MEFNQNRLNMIETKWTERKRNWRLGDVKEAPWFQRPTNMLWSAANELASVWSDRHTSAWLEGWRGRFRRRTFELQTYITSQPKISHQVWTLAAWKRRISHSVAVFFEIQHSILCPCRGVFPSVIHSDSGQKTRDKCDMFTKNYWFGPLLRYQCLQKDGLERLIRLNRRICHHRKDSLGQDWGSGVLGTHLDEGCSLGKRDGGSLQRI